MIRRRLIVVAVGLAVVSTGAAPAGAVVGGSPVPPGSNAFVVKVNVGAARACSGALVTPEWVVTAASCFAVDGQPVSTGAPTLPTTVTVGRFAPSVVRIVPHPSRDVLLAKLSLRVADVVPIAVSGTAPAAGESIGIAGYGRSATEWVPDQLYAATATVGSVGADSFSWTGQDVSACKGDAGGPVFRDSGGQLELVGIDTAAGQGGCLWEADTPPGATAVRVDDLKTWIEANTPGLTTEFGAYFHSSDGLGGYNLADGHDLAVPFDYDHSGKLDHLVLYRPGTGTVWIVKHAPNDTYTPVYHSSSGIGGYDLRSTADRIVAFDYDHSGKVDHLLLYRPGAGRAFVVEHGTDGTFTTVYSSTTAGIGGYNLGDARDQVVPFDYEHSGKLDHLVLYRPGTGVVWVVKHGTGDDFSAVFTSDTGLPGYSLKVSVDRIVAFDYDHSGKLDHLVLYRPGTKTIFILQHGAGTTFTTVYSSSTAGIGGFNLADRRDQVVAFDYERTGRLDHLVLYRPGTGTVWILQHGTGSAFSAVFNSSAGIGGYNLASTADRIVAFDDAHSGGQNHLLLYRPGSRTAWVVGRREPPAPAPVTAQPAGTAGSIVEDFTHPGADRILAEHGLKLFQGDGHILFVTSRPYGEGQCEVGQIQVERSLDVAPYGIYYCFRTFGTQGYLTLEVPSTFNIRGGNTPAQATAQLPDGDRIYPVPPNTYVPVEPGDGSEPPQAILVELRLR